VRASSEHRRQAQTSLIDPQTDGRYVLGRIRTYAEIGP